MSDETTLLPCPFCGGEAKIVETEHAWYMNIEHEPICFYAAEIGDEWTKVKATEAWNTRATLCNGKLTAGQVREAVEHHGIASLGCRWQFIDRSYDAIADELNATLGSGTCECDGTIQWRWTGPTTYYEHELSCGHVITSVDEEPPNYCEECGAKVRKAVSA